MEFKKSTNPFGSYTLEKKVQLSAQEYANKSPWIKGTISKGKLIVVGDETFRILSVDGTKIKVMAMQGPVRTFDSQSTLYSNSELDVYLFAMYQSYPEELRNAIVKEYTVQNRFLADLGTSKNAQYNGERSDHRKYYLSQYNPPRLTGQRHIYAMDIKDVMDYLGPNNLTSESLLRLFYNDPEAKHAKPIWLRSEYVSRNGFVMAVFRDLGFIGRYSPLNEAEVRACFILDLSLLPLEEEDIFDF